MEIKQNLTNINYNSANKVNKYIVVHYTANSTDTALNNTKYFKSVNRSASANYFVDDNDIYQCVLDKDIAWHCGGNKLNNGGGTYYGKCTNANSIGVEMCCTNYGVSEKTEANAIELVKYLMNKYNIPASNVIRHYDVTGKNCPKPFVENAQRWADFKSKLGGSAEKTAPVQSSKPSCTGDITYKVYDNAKGCYLPTVVNDRDYAGNRGHAIGGIKAMCKNGNIYMKTHVIGKANWEDTVTLNASNFDSNSANAYSGILGRNIDMVKIWSDYGYVDYRVSPINGNYYDWVNSKDVNSGGANSYAGVAGKAIDRIQMK